MTTTNYIHANARFAFRSDTSENWESINPVLLAGEFGVATNGSESKKVKIGDGETAWNSLSWWTGEKGEKGDKGDNYILVEEDKQEIANLVLNALPIGDEVDY